MRNKAPDASVRDKIIKVKLLILDVDGVLTDGRIIYDSEGRESRSFDAQDGIGILLLRAAGIKTIMITIKPSKAVEYRARDLKVEEVYQGVKPKTKALQQILAKHGLNRDEICYVGDDLVDIGMMKAVGFPVAVENAAREVKEAASYVTERLGGRGAVREIAELILKTQGKWNKLLDTEFAEETREEGG
jgi:3-deoxy-D-manno-octulosonate 8-phosphate phosphatase (KDO 8-P phosphatase)